jgi:Lipocalin-like domain
MFEPNGRMMGMIVSDGRTAATSDSGMAGLFRSMMAYSGRWSMGEEKFVTEVDMAWDPSWIGTKQVRYYKFDGSKLSLRTTPIDHPSFPSQKIVAYVDWEREK